MCRFKITAIVQTKQVVQYVSRNMTFKCDKEILILGDVKKIDTTKVGQWVALVLRHLMTYNEKKYLHFKMQKEIR